MSRQVPLGERPFGVLKVKQDSAFSYSYEIYSAGI